MDYDSDRENGNLASVSSNRPGSENESARGTDSEDGGFVLIKRRRLELPGISIGRSNDLVIEQQQ